LDKHKVDYKIVEYKVDEKNQPIVACIAGDEELDLKALAKVAGVKKCVMIPLKDVLKVTGYVRGGCSPFGMKKIYRTFIDSDALLHVEFEKIVF